MPGTWTALTLVTASVGITFTFDAAVDNAMQAGVAVVPLKEGREPTFSRLAWRTEDRNPALRAVLRASESVPLIPKV